MTPRAGAPALPLSATLKVRNFRIFLTGQLVSNIGGWTQRVAQDWLVLTITGSAAAVGVVTALQFLPTLLLGPYGGALADRYPKRRILFGTQSVLAMCAAGLAVLTLTGAIAPWHIYLLAAVLGIAVAIDNPSRQAFVSELVGPDHIRQAISLNSAAFHVGALVGPAVSGVLISVVGMGWSFAVNALTFGASLAALLLIRVDALVRESGPAIAGRFVATYRHVRLQPHLWWPMVLAGFFSLYTANLPVVLTSFAADVFDSGPGGLALLTSMLAVGSLVGSVLASRRRSTRLRGLVGMAALLVIALLAAAVAPGQAAFAVLLIGVGVASVSFAISANSTVQLAAEGAIRGRVMGMYLIAALGGGCIGGPLVGTLNELVGPRTSLLIGAGMCATATIVVAVLLSRAMPPAEQPNLRRITSYARSVRPLSLRGATR